MTPSFRWLILISASSFFFATQHTCCAQGLGGIRPPGDAIPVELEERDGTPPAAAKTPQPAGDPQPAATPQPAAPQPAAAQKEKVPDQAGDQDGEELAAAGDEGAAAEEIKYPPLEKHRLGHFQIQRQNMPATIYARAVYSFGVTPNYGSEVHWIKGKNDIEYEVEVSQSYQPGKPAGVFVFISASDKGNLSPDYYATLGKRNMIAIGANLGGNKIDSAWRIGMAAYAVGLLDEAYDLDYDRIYISGGSGGGRAASIGMLGYQDVFSGGMPIVGANAVLPMKNAASKSKGETYQDPGIKTFKLTDMEIAATTGRYAFMSGETDFNRMNCQLVAEGYTNYGFQFVSYFEEPGKGHGLPSPEWFEKGLDFLDAPVAQIAASRLKSAKKVTRKQPGLAARQYQSVVMHVEDASMVQTAQEALDEITADYHKELEKIRSKIEKSKPKSATTQLEKFAFRWLDFAADDIAAMKDAVDAREEK